LLALQGQNTLYLVLDALDECPNSSGFPTQRGEVLEIVKGLINLKLRHLRVCVTSRPEVEIQMAFGPLNPYNVSLHIQRGQIEDLAKYVESIVYSDTTMQAWPDLVKKMVIDTLGEKGGGMYVIMVICFVLLSHAMTSGLGGRIASWRHCASVPRAIFQVP
jgi:hypothetical protein